LAGGKLHDSVVPRKQGGALRSASRPGACGALRCTARVVVASTAARPCPSHRYLRCTERTDAVRRLLFALGVPRSAIARSGMVAPFPVLLADAQPSAVRCFVDRIQ